MHRRKTILQYLENKLHAFGDKPEPASVLLHGSIGGGGSHRRGVRSNRSVSERVEEPFGSCNNSGKVNGVIYGFNWGNLVEADVEPGGAVGEVAARE